MSYCKNCIKQNARQNYTYCSNQCQLDYQHDIYIKKWKSGEVSGERGINAKNISQHVRKYLVDKYGNRCSQCSWSETNETTGLVPLEIDHINGNAENNTEANLRLVCPNCHALTANFRNLNKGMGRSWRKLKYNKSEA